jgi:cell division protein FtsL
MRRVPQSYPNTRVRRTADPRASRRQKLLLAGCLVLACGFVFAVSRQIMAVEYGYKTEALRREREQLLDEQRRLLLAVEENSSPAQLEQAARGLGMQPATAAQIETAAHESAPARAVEEPHRGARVGLGAAAAASVMRR